MFISSPLKGFGLMPINCRVFLGKHKIILRKFSLSLQDTYQAPGYLIPEQGWQGFRLFRFGSFFAPAPAGNHILFQSYKNMRSQWLLSNHLERGTEEERDAGKQGDVFGIFTAFPHSRCSSLQVWIFHGGVFRIIILRLNQLLLLKDKIQHNDPTQKPSVCHAECHIFINNSLM